MKQEPVATCLGLLQIAAKTDSVCYHVYRDKDWLVTSKFIIFIYFYLYLYIFLYFYLFI